MITFERELQSIRPLLGAAATNALVARERREAFSLYPELRVLAWGGAMLLAASAAIVLQKHFDAIGPALLAVAMGIASLACYVWVWWRRARATVADDYILVLAAFLFSSDVAFIESQFQLLDQHWPQHFLVVALVHGVTAYAYRSRALLALSIAAFAAWMGIDRRTLEMWNEPVEAAVRAFVTALLVLGWCEMNRRRGGPAEFLRMFEHFSANLAALGGLLLLGESQTWLFCVAVAIVAWGFRTRAESFVLYGFVYAVIAVDAYALDKFVDELPHALVLFVITKIIAVFVLTFLRRRFRRERA